MDRLDMSRAYAATASARIATRLVFFVAGFAIACLAPLIPAIKEQLEVNSAQFGGLLFFIGLGSIIAMPVSGLISARRGARVVTILSGLVIVVTLPVLASSGHVALTAASLFVFGGALGSLDVAMNVHGAQIETREARPLMSGFHALFSVGGLCGAGIATMFLSVGLSAALVGAICGAIALVIHLIGAPRFVQQPSAAPVPFALPRGVVLVIAVLSSITFLLEGAVLDWGALLIIERDLAIAQNAGIGFILFSVAMVAARLSGDLIVSRAGERATIITSGLIMVGGIALLLGATAPPAALSGFAVIGLGAGNIVPILFSAAGKQSVMQPALAITSVTTVGYLGLMIGPALVGVAAEATSLATSFALLAILAFLIPAFAGVVTHKR